MSDTDTRPADDSKKTRREADQVEKRLAEAPVTSTGSVTLTHGRVLDYQAICEYLPVAPGGFGDERADYGQALARHHADGPRAHDPAARIDASTAHHAIWRSPRV